MFFYQWGMVEKGSFKCLRSVGFFIGTMHDIHGQFTNNYEKKDKWDGTGVFCHGLCGILYVHSMGSGCIHRIVCTVYTGWLIGIPILEHHHAE